MKRMKSPSLNWTVIHGPNPDVILEFHFALQKNRLVMVFQTVLMVQTNGVASIPDPLKVANVNQMSSSVATAFVARKFGFAMVSKIVKMVATRKIATLDLITCQAAIFVKQPNSTVVIKPVSKNHMSVMVNGTAQIMLTRKTVPVHK